MDKFKQTIQAKSDKEKKAENQRLRDAIGEAVRGGGSAGLGLPVTPLTGAVAATMAAAANITPGNAGEVGAMLDAM